MSYLSLARKYRPQKFSDLIGQEHIAQALKNSLLMQRPPSAVLLSGVRGVGKTTIARLYAKALNCKSLQQGEPCETCDSCIEATRGAHEDILEIDGASNNGVDEVRLLQETLNYFPQRAQYKVYIIDEVHMLSTNAFNALLKTLEEPPKNVVFIFATTELSKLPETVVGRCQSFHLKKIPVPSIRERLQMILQNEKIPFEEKTLVIIAREGRGSLRDALTLLDQAIALGDGKVDIASLAPILGNLSTEPYLTFIDGLLRRDVDVCFQSIDHFDQLGLETTVVVNELARMLRFAFMLKHVSEKNLSLIAHEVNEEDITGLKTLASLASPLDLNRLFRTILSCLKELDGSVLDRFVLENYCCEWCFDPPLWEGQSMVAYFSGKQETISVAEPNSAPEPKMQQAVAPQQQPPLQPLNSVPLDKFEMPTSWRAFVDIWKKRKPLQGRKLEEVYPVEFSKDKIVIAVEEQSIASSSLLSKETQDKLRAEFKEVFGFQGVFQVIPKSTNNKNVNKDSKQSLLEENAKNKVFENASLEQKAHQHPLTTSILKTFGGVIAGTKIEGSDL